MQCSKSYYQDISMNQPSNYIANLPPSNQAGGTEEDEVCSQWDGSFVTTSCFALVTPAASVSSFARSKMLCCRLMLMVTLQIGLAH